MTRFEINKAPEPLRVKMIGELYDIFSSLKNREEVKFFLRDLLNPDEIAMLRRRIMIATLIKKGYTFEDISSNLRVGKTTVSSVKNSLDRHGEGYDLVIERFEKIQAEREALAAQIEKQRSVVGPSPRKYAHAKPLMDLLDDIRKK